MKVNNHLSSQLSGEMSGVKASKNKTEGDLSLLNQSEESDGIGGAGSSRATKIHLSERAQQMQRAKEIASEESIDEAKVARLQKMIDEGAYQVDAASIADRLVDEHLMLPE